MCLEASWRCSFTELGCLPWDVHCPQLIRQLHKLHHQTSGDVPLDMAMQCPHAGIVGLEPDHSVSFAWNSDCVTAKGIDCRKLRFSFLVQSLAQSDYLENMPVQMERMLAGKRVVENDLNNGIPFVDRHDVLSDIILNNLLQVLHHRGVPWIGSVGDVVQVTAGNIVVLARLERDPNLDALADGLQNRDGLKRVKLKEI